MTVEKTDVVSYVVEKLAAYYGSSWDRSLGQAPIADVKTVWQHELSSFTRTPIAKMAVLWALENLPERAPNAIVFRNLCRQAPAVEDEPKLPAPAPDPARLKAELEKLGGLRAKVTAVISGRLDWAHALKAKDELNPRSVTPTVRKRYQEALRGPAA